MYADSLTTVAQGSARSYDLLQNMAKSCQSSGAVLLAQLVNDDGRVMTILLPHSLS